MKKFFLIVCAVLFSLFASFTMAEELQTYTLGDYQYLLVDNETVCITHYNGNVAILDIPAELDGHIVTSIGENAFSSCHCTEIHIPNSITKLDGNPFKYSNKLCKVIVSPDHPTLEIIDNVLFSKDDKRLIWYPMTAAPSSYAIPQGIQSIGASAFYECSNLIEISIPNSIISIEDYAFEGCNSLTKVTIPDTVLSIGSNPFKGCKGLDSIKIAPDHPALSIIDGVLFSKSDKRLIWYPSSASTSSYSIPKGIKTIGDYAFYFCKNLKKVTIPNSMSTIGNGAFCFCMKLSEINISNSVTTIGDFAFSNCLNLKDIILPDSVISIGKYTFYMCNFSKIIIPNSVSSIGDSAFASCSKLTTITLPNSVENIGTMLFDHCDNLSIINVSPDHPILQTTDGVLFRKSDKRLLWYPKTANTSSYTIPDGTEIIGECTFYGCTALNEIIFPTSITIIEDNAFSDCTELTKIEIPINVTSIGNYSFSGCKNLSAITIPENVVNIGEKAFNNCSSNLTLTVTKGSYPEQYAKAHDINYIYPDSFDWLNN